MIEVENSSNITKIGYTSELKQGFVQFKNGSQYVIKDMPPAIWDAWLAFESKGGFFANIIKKSYTVEKVN